MKKKIIKTCYLCSGEKFKKRPGKVRDNPDIEVLECLSCGLVFLSSFEHICEGFYESSGMHEKQKDIDSWLRETAVDDERRVNFVSRLIENKAVLDFGCGPGGFLLRARDIAAKLSGIEIEARLETHFQKNKLRVYRSIKEVGEFYDVITFFHVLEHMPEPVEILKMAAEKLNEGGSIIVELPNASDALLTLYENKAFSEFTYWGCHLFLFTVKTVSMLAEKAGLKVNYLKQVQRYPLSNHLYWLSKGKPGGHKFWGYLDSGALHDAYEEQLASLGLCDTIIASFSKSSSL